MGSGARDFAFSISSRVFMLMIALANQICLARMLGPADRGSYGACVAFMTALMLIFMVGTDVAGMYYVASRRFTISEGVSNTLLSGLIGSAAAILAGFLILRLPLGFVSKAAPHSFNLSLILIPFMFYGHAYVSLLMSLHEIVWYSIVSTVTAVSQLALFLWFVLILRWGVDGALWALILNNVLIVLLSFLVFRRRHGLTWCLPTWSGIKDVFHYGVRYYVGKVTNNLNTQLGTIFLSMFASKEAIAMFDLGSQLTSRISVIPDAMATVLVPRVAGDQGGRKDLVAQCARLMIVICGVPLLILSLFAPFFVGILFTSAYLPTVSIIRILSIGFLVHCACKGFITYLWCTNRPGTASVCVAAGMLMNLGLMWPLIHWMGLAGAALATTANYVVSSALLMRAFRQTSGKGLKETWLPHRADWAALAPLLRMTRGQMASGNPTPGCSQASEVRRRKRPDPSGRRIPVPGRELVFLRDVIIKRNAPKLIRLEAEKTRRAFRIAEKTGLFKVPRILDCDPDKGEIVFERIRGIRNSEQLITFRPNGVELVRTMGRALAAIHRELTLPADMVHPLPEQFPPSENAGVFLHGDYTPGNICLGKTTEPIVVLDWLMTRMHGEWSTYGTRYYDLTWFVASLFINVPRFPLCEPQAPVAKAFLRSYFEASGCAYDEPGLRAYMKEFFARRLHRAKVNFMRTRVALVPQQVRLRAFVDSFRL
jgi:O-antigen/teichoic acid export membrane protein